MPHDARMASAAVGVGVGDGDVDPSAGRECLATKQLAPANPTTGGSPAASPARFTPLPPFPLLLPLHPPSAVGLFA